MAILNKIRQRSLFLILIIAMALFSFVLADLFKNADGFSAKSQSIVGTINGIDLERDDFNLKVENAQQRFGRGASVTQAMNVVWEQELRRVIMESQFDKLGISVERDQMRSLLEQNLNTFEEFKNEIGNFDENKLNEFIANLKAIAPEQSFLGGTPITYQSWNEFESNIAVTGTQQTYFNMVKAGLTATLNEGEWDHKLSNDKVDVKFVQIPYTSIPDSTITVTKSDIAKYINDNPSKYEVEDSRDLSYVIFRETASLDDENAIKAEMIALLNGDDRNIGFKNTDDHETYLTNNNSTVPYSDNFLFKNQLGIASDSIYDLEEGQSYGPYKEGGFFKITKIVEEGQLPDSAKVRHILIPYTGATRVATDVTKTPEQAKATADSILGVLKRNRSKFKDLLSLSSDLVSNEKGGEIEMAYNSGFAQEFKDFSFENNKGDIDVVETAFGYHIIEILEQKNFQKVLKIATLGREIQPSEETIDEVFRSTSKFEIAVANKDFNEVAQENNYTVRPVNSIKELDENIPGVGIQRAMVRWAFENETNIGDVKRFSVPGGGFAVAQLKAKTPKGLMSVEKASITAIPEIRKQKKAQSIKDRVNPGTMEEIATAEGQTVRTALAINMKSTTLTGAGLEPMVIGAAFGLQEGETSQLITGNSGVYIVQVTKTTPATELQSYQAVATRIGNTKAAQSSTALYEALKKAADVEDNRATFY